MAESRSVMLNLIGRNNTSRAFRGAADDADRLASRLDRAGASSAKTSKAFEVLTGRAATMTSALVAIAPAAGAAGAAAVGAAGAMAAAFASAGAALGAFGLAVKPQVTAIGELAKASDTYDKAVKANGASSTQAKTALKAYKQQLGDMPPATAKAATAFLGLREQFGKWSDSLAGDTMPIFTKGIGIASRLLPKLTPLVKTGAAALRDFVGQLDTDSKSSGFAQFLNRLNATAKKTLPPLLRSVRNVAIGLGGIVDAFLPHAGAMASGVEGLTARFADWGKSLKDSESFKGFIAYIRQNLPALKETFGNLVQIVVNLATAFAPMTGISLLLVKHFSAMLAALPPPVVTALATAFVAASTAARIWVPIQTALNVVLSANPIGLVVLAIAGLVAGLVLAYKKSETFRGIVNGVWAGVKGAVGSAWTETIKPALLGLGDLFSRAARIWQDKWPQLQQLLNDAAMFFRDTLGTAVDTLAGGFRKLGGAAEGAGGKISGVGGDFQVVQDDGNRFLTWSNIFSIGLGAALLGPAGGILGYFTRQFWPQLKTSWTEGFKLLGSKTSQFATWLPGALGRGMSAAASGLKTSLARIKQNLFDGLPPLRLSWSGFWNWTSAFAHRLLDQTVGGIRRAMSAAKQAFSSGVSGMKSSWDRLPAAIRGPINWVINRGYNDGIKRLWNTVIGWLKLPGGLKLGNIAALETGGTLANPAQARPMKTNGPMAIVGEGRKQFPEYVIPTDPRFRGRAQALWASAGGDLQMLAKGGVLGGPFGDVLGAVKKAAGKVTGIGKTAMAMLENPRKYWDSLASKVMPRPGEISGGGKFGAGMSGVPGKLLAHAWASAQQVIKTFAKAYGGDSAGVVKAAERMIGMGDDRGENNNWLTRAWGMPGAPWCAMFVSEAIKKAGATKKYPGYPSAAVASYVGAMRHVGQGEGRPGDLGAYRGTGHINVIAKNLGGGVYETIGGNEGSVVRRGTRGGQSAILRPMARGGIMDQRRKDLRAYRERNLDPGDRKSPLLRYMRHATYDRGGLLQPGYTLAYNGTGRPEPVLSLARGGKVSAGRSTATTTSRAARQSAGTSLVKALTGSVIGDAGKLASWFNKLDAAIRKAFAGGTERKLIAWSNSIQKAMSTAATKAAGISTQIAQAKEYAGTVAQSAKDFASLSNLRTRGTGQQVALGLTERASQITNFASQITQLKKRGLAGGLLSQVIGMGVNDGTVLARTLLSSDAATLKKMNAAQGVIDKASVSLGQTAANALYDAGKGAGKGFLSGLYAQRAALDKEMTRLGRKLAGGVGKSFGVKPKVVAAQAVKYDSGGMLQPGFTLAYNATGRPEPVLTSGQYAAATSGTNGGPLVNIEHMEVRETADVDLLASRLGFAARAAAF